MKAKLLLFLALGCAISAPAAHLTPEQALDRALSGSSQMRAKSLKARQLKQAKVNSENLYVFTTANNSGYLITSADDRLRPILGYSDNGTIDPANLSPDLQWWLSEYDREIEALMPAEEAVCEGLSFEKAAQTKSAITDNYAKWSPIAPLVTSKWNQSAPYNDLCPRFNNSEAYNRCVTGCVATAMAQVVYCNKYFCGSGTKTYKPAVSGWATENTVSFDYENADIDFTKMKDTYTAADSGTEAGNAVATLMLACGVGVEMMYGTGESGAYSSNIATALINHFGYDPAATRWISRLNMTTDLFEETIYNELSNGRPVCYGGSSATGGHSFVCDGYDSNGLFHFNWGWGGLSDGYYTLTALNPGEQGIGSSDGGYNYWQDITIAAIPGSVNANTTPPVQGALTATADGKKFTPQIQINADSDAEKIYIGVKIEYSYGYSSVINWSYANYTKTTYTFGSGSFNGGSSYINKAYVVYRLDESDPWITPPAIKNKSNFVFVDWDEDNNKSFRNPYASGQPDIRLSNVTLNSPYASSLKTLTFNATNVGGAEFNGGLCIGLTKNDTETWYYAMSGTSKGQSIPISYPTYYTAMPVDQSRKIGFPCSTLGAGKYKLQLLTNGGNLVSNDVLEFEVLSGSGSNTETLTSDWTVVDESLIPELWMKGDTFTHTVKVRSARANSYYVKLKVNIYDKGTDNIRQTWTSKWGWGLTSATTYNLTGVNEQGDVFTIDLPFGTYDLQYYIYPTGNDSNYKSYVSSQRRTIRVGETTDGYVIAPDAEGSGVCVMKAPDGDVEIPASFNISGLTYPTTEIDGGLYQYSKTLTGVTLPACVKKIGTYAFDGCSQLKYVVLNNPEPAFDYVQVIAQNSNNDCAWYVPRGSYDNYREALNTHPLYEMPSAITSYEVYMDRGEKATLQQPFDQPGKYNYTVSNSKPSVAKADNDLNITGLATGINTVTVTTPSPFAASANIRVNVIVPVETKVENLAQLWENLKTADLLPTVTPGVMRSRHHYKLDSGMHVFDRQPGYVMASDLALTNERFHGFKLSNIDETTDHSKVLKVAGRLVSDNGINSLQLTETTVGNDEATPVAQSIAFGTFDPATDAAEWLHTYVRLWCANYDATRGVLNGFSKARSGEASELTVKNLNNVTLPSTSNRYNPAGYIDMDSDGNYFFVPTEDFGAISTGISEIDAEAAAGDDARYFNLQGIEVTGTPAPGLYIRKAAGTTTKLVVR